MSLVTAASTVVPAPEPVARLLRDLVHERTGVFFEDDRFDILVEKLEPRVRDLGCPSYLEYYYILKYEEKGPEEWRRVMDAFSVQETYFWREADQIDALVAHVIPAWFRTHTTPFRIWSAACASGEEPYTIAMAIREAGLAHYPIEIVATDGSESALSKARHAVYRERSFRVIAPALREKYFSATPAGHKLCPEITQQVRFRWANLVNASDTNAFASAEAIFCRNVFIYFSPAAISRVVASFAARMAPGAHLFVGSSESLLKLTQDFELEALGKAFVYVRKPRL